MNVSLIEAAGAALLVLGSFLVIRAVWVADTAPSEPANHALERPEEETPVQRAA